MILQSIPFPSLGMLMPSTFYGPPRPPHTRALKSYKSFESREKKESQVKKNPRMSFPSVSRRHIVQCALPTWYPQFVDVTLKSRLLTLPREFVQYLEADGIMLPSSDPVPRYANRNLEDDWEDEEEEEEEVEEEEENENSQTDELQALFAFPELEAQIREAISDLGGVVFPKLNWSSPRDATWIVPGGTLKCTTVSDICLLLKSSDFIAHDLARAFENCSEDSTNGDSTQITSGQSESYPIVLVLRKWFDLHPSMEFRCFVCKKELIAVCQRDYSNFYQHLVDKKDIIQEKIAEFFETRIRDRFPEDQYVFDVYVNSNNWRVWLIDFNPWSSVTDPLMFSWDELLEVERQQQLAEEVGDFDFRIVESRTGIQISPLAVQRLPQDMYNLDPRDIDDLIETMRKSDLSTTEVGQ